jgi:hypothetical protein
MRPSAVGIFPFTQPSSVSPQQGEPLAQTTHAAHAEGLTAYVVRTKDEAPSKNTSSASANVNDPKAPQPDFSADLQHAQTNTYTQSTSAKFLTPDSLLTKREQAQVNHLRARDAAIKKEADELNGSDAAGLSFVYETGPDGRNYIIGMATPLVLQNMPGNAGQAPPALTEQEHDAALAAYQRRAGTSSPLRADLIDNNY